MSRYKWWIGSIVFVGACGHSLGSDEQGGADNDQGAGGGDIGTVSQAATVGGQCLDDRFESKIGGAPTNCTSNDVGVAEYTLMSGPTSCLPGDTINVILKAKFVSTAAERYDVGIFIAQDGGDAKTTGGVCYNDYLHEASLANPIANDDLNLTGGSGPFYNGEWTGSSADPNDVCGDIQQGQDAFLLTGLVSIKCQDSNGDGIADVGTCTGWDNQTGNTCTSELDTTAHTKAKCTCGSVNISGLSVPKTGTITVNKILVPSIDSGKFNLQIDGTSKATDVGNGGTTGPVIVSAGTVPPGTGAFHSVGEVAGTGTDLTNYDSSILCTSNQGHSASCTNCTSFINLNVLPDEQWTCDVTNTLKDLCVLNNVICPPNGPCGTFACNPSTGACELTAQPATTICRPSAGACDVAESCTGNSAACPADGFAAMTTICRPSAGACDVAESCTGNSAACPADGFAPMTTICRASAGVCDVAESCSGSAAACPADGFAAATTICRASAGVCDVAESCTGSAAACPADGFAAATTICRASAGVCDVAESCSGSAAACPADGFAAATTICRASAGVCDVAESCSGTGAACPADGFAAMTTICRASAGVCDVAESCSGTGAACPADGFAAMTTICRESAGVCDVAESCSGTGAACPADGFAAMTTICRASAGVCDVAESCSGTGAACPADGFAAMTTICRASAGVCDVAESCTGSAAACPADGFAAATTICRASAGVCDVAESCSGTGAACPADSFAAATTICRASAGVCDVAESCSGTGAACPADGFAAMTTICRESAGVCDVAESCSGSAAACPDDGFAAATTICRASAGVCDVAESCSGTGAACPADGFAAATTICRASAGVCDVAESCSGSGAACPDDGKQPATTICRAAAGECDLAESCDGISNSCSSDQKKPATTICRPATSDCDPAESCDGSTNICPADQFLTCLPPKILMTGTSCEQYTSNSATDLTQIQYLRKGSQPITSTNPGLFFEYDQLHLTTTSIIKITQTNSAPDKSWNRRLDVNQNQVILYDLNCNIIYNLSSSNFPGLTLDTTNGDVTITGVPAGDYILSVKYSTNGVVGCTTTDCPNNGTTYTFAKTVNGIFSGSDSVRFVSKK